MPVIRDRLSKLGINNSSELVSDAVHSKKKKLHSFIATLFMLSSMLPIYIVPRKKYDSYKYWWDEEFDALKSDSIRSQVAWRDDGHLRSDPAILDMQKRKLGSSLQWGRMKLIKILCQQRTELCFIMKYIGRFWRAKFDSCRRVKSVNGCNNDHDVDVADKFAPVFEWAHAHQIYYFHFLSRMTCLCSVLLKLIILHFWCACCHIRGCWSSN